MQEPLYGKQQASTSNLHGSHIYIYAPKDGIGEIFITSFDITRRDLVQKYASRLQDRSLRGEKTFKKEYKNLSELVTKQAQQKSLALAQGPSPVERVLVYSFPQRDERKLSELITDLHEEDEYGKRKRIRGPISPK